MGKFLLLACLVVGTVGFFGGKAAKTSPKNVSPLTQEAIDLWSAKYPFNREPLKTNESFEKFASLGVPKTDIDGTRVRKDNYGEKRRLTDLTEQDVSKNFNALCAVYGEDRAIDMVKIFPICLSFNSNDFAKSYEAWSDIFGAEESLDMVSRNPGLLAVSPSDAASSTDQTMYFSYIIAATRPIGIFGPIIILLLLTVPGIEGATGIQIKEPFLNAISFGLI